MKNKFNLIVFMVLMFMVAFITPVWGYEVVDEIYVVTPNNSVDTPPENDDGSPYGSSYQNQDSGLIPSYGTTGFDFENKKVGSIVTKLLDYVYVMAGIILLVMLVTGGLGLMTAAGNPDKMKAGYGKITNALIGFLIIFISYFVVQLVETILGIKIL